MKRIICVIAMTVVSLVVFAQNQQGYVKTKGRLGNNGTVIAGSRLSGATVQVKGSNAVVSGSNGTFTLAIPGNNYYLQSVQKQGYVVTDPDMLSHQYAYSKNPLVLVLETPSRQTDDRLAAEKKIRRTLQRQLQEKEDEIEILKEQQKLSDEAYRQRLQEVYAQQESNEKLVSEMAERYSRMDFDEVDEFNRRISSLILEGKLTEADSLLNTKGDINSRAANLRQHQAANAQAELELKKKQKKLEKSKALTQKELEDLAQDCYSKFEIFKMQHQNDSAAHYIELRANLDTTNIAWNIEAGKFLQKYLAQYDEAMTFLCRYIHDFSLHSRDDSLNIIEPYEAIASLLSAQGKHKEALVYCEKDLQFTESLLGTHHQWYISSLVNLANNYRKIGDLEKTSELLKKALSLTEESKSASISTVVKVYGNAANFYSNINNHNLALSYYLKADSLLDTVTESYPLETITTYSNIGQTFFQLGQYDIAEDWDKKSIDLINKVLGNQHPEMATVLNNLGAVYQKKKQYELALSCVERSVEIDKLVYGRLSPMLIQDYNNLGVVNFKVGHYDQALENYQLAQSIFVNYYPSNHPYLAFILNNIGTLYVKMEEYDRALGYYDKALAIRIEKYGHDNSAIASIYESTPKTLLTFFHE